MTLFVTTATLPTAWPSPAEWMSYSQLSELEGCPLQWSLRNASYSAIWSGRGYPEPLYQATIQGRVVHRAVELIVDQLAQAGCSSISSDGSVAVLRALGGFSSLIESCIEEMLDAEQSNPRAAPVLQRVGRVLRQNAAAMRRSVQGLLAKRRVVARAGGLVAAGHRSAIEHNGSYTEVEVRDPGLTWRGIIDLLTIHDEECEILDYKTGDAHAEHLDQVRIYSLLWARDRERNPSGRRATSLMVSYVGEDVEALAPVDAELDALEVSLRERTANVRAALQSSPPVANPEPDRCPWCPVRQLCTDYWTLRGGAAAWPDDGAFVDVELEVVRNLDRQLWEVNPRVIAGIAAPGPCRLRIPREHVGLRVHQRVRLLSAVFGFDGEVEAVPTLACVSGTEVHIVPD